MNNRLNTAPYLPDIDDPLVLQVAWTSLGAGAANFTTHELAYVYKNKLEFQATKFTIGFSSIFIIWGLGVFLAGLYSSSTFIVIIGLLMLIFTISMAYYMTIPIVFDKECGLFWKAHKKPSMADENNKKKIFGRLKNIHAIQLLQESHTDSDGDRYHSHNLNLVLTDASRINIINHRGKGSVMNNAKKLARFLNVPIWDADAVPT